MHALPLGLLAGPRLVGLKNQYDSSNVLHLNQNIRPTT
jgi:hypothetical protein